MFLAMVTNSEEVLKETKIPSQIIFDVQRGLNETVVVFFWILQL